MERLTHERKNGIKSGYWSPDKKEELVQRLAAYEDTGLGPDDLKKLIKKQIPKSRPSLGDPDGSVCCGHCHSDIATEEDYEFCPFCGGKL